MHRNLVHQTNRRRYFQSAGRQRHQGSATCRQAGRKSREKTRRHRHSRAGTGPGHGPAGAHGGPAVQGGRTVHHLSRKTAGTPLPERSVPRHFRSHRKLSGQHRLACQRELQHGPLLPGVDPAHGRFGPGPIHVGKIP